MGRKASQRGAQLEQDGGGCVSQDLQACSAERMVKKINGSCSNLDMHQYTSRSLLRYCGPNGDPAQSGAPEGTEPSLKADSPHSSAGAQSWLAG